MKNEFEIGDLVSHSQRGYLGVIIEIVPTMALDTPPIYKVTWEHGEWMYEIEEQLTLEAKASESDSRK